MEAYVIAAGVTLLAGVLLWGWWHKRTCALCRWYSRVQKGS